MAFKLRELQLLGKIKNRNHFRQYFSAIKFKFNLKKQRYVEINSHKRKGDVNPFKWTAL